jgi:hypothetical protein
MTLTFKYRCVVEAVNGGRHEDCGFPCSKEKNLEILSGGPHPEKVGHRLEAVAELLQLNLALCESFFGRAFAPKLASPDASRPASGSRSGVLLP